MKYLVDLGDSIVSNHTESFRQRVFIRGAIAP